MIDSNKLFVSGDKVFYSIQGEGQSIGRPAVFLRLGYCNLKCKWCDTKYSWSKEVPGFEEIEEWSINKTLKEIKKFPTNRLVITGGEPLLQIKGVSKLIDLLPDWTIEFETNGTVMPTKKLLRRCQFNISPKLENSGNPVEIRLKPDVLKELNNASNSTFKFVIKNRLEIEEVSKMVKKYKIDGSKVIIMPEGIDQQDMIKNTKRLAEEAKKTNWRIVPRLHIILWGNKRKV